MASNKHPSTPEEASDLNSPAPGWRHYRVAHGVLIEDGGVLLVANQWYPGEAAVWSLPGGRCEDGEPAVEAVVREFREETGLDVEPGPLIYVAESRSAVRGLHYLVCAFAVRRTGGTLSGSSDPVVVEARFVPLAEIARYLPVPSLGAPLRHWLDDPTAPPHYWYFPEYTRQ